MKRQVHLSELTQFEIFFNHGFSDDDSIKLSQLTVGFTFKMLDNLYDAIKIIKRGLK
jgi:hypothetical protein